jgi:rhamnogalacturonan acetylesterase
MKPREDSFSQGVTAGRRYLHASTIVNREIISKLVSERRIFCKNIRVCARAAAEEAVYFGGCKLVESSKEGWYSMAFVNLRRMVFSSAMLMGVASGMSGQAPDLRPPETPRQHPLTEQQSGALNPKLPTVFVVGDSTARNSADLGWGDHFAHLFDTSRINVANRARAGRSSRTYRKEGAWDAVLGEMKAGDFVLLQMGHNDGGDLDGAKPRGTLKGLGDESKEVVLPGGEHETVHTYGWYIRAYIAEARAKGAQPILLTLTVRNLWTNGRIERDMGYDAELRQLAAEQHVPLVDMGGIAADRFEAMGEQKTALLFPKDHTHTSAEGAELNAEAVVDALKQVHSPLVAYLKPSSSKP